MKRESFSLTGNTCSNFYDRKHNSIWNSNSLCQNKTEYKEARQGTHSFGDMVCCEALTCSKPSNSDIWIHLKSGNKIFFRLCSFCKETIEKELVDEEIEK